jgi:hypothetical protein
MLAVPSNGHCIIQQYCYVTSPTPLAVWQNGSSSLVNHVNTCDVIAAARNCCAGTVFQCCCVTSSRLRGTLVYRPVPSKSVASSNKGLTCHNINLQSPKMLTWGPSPNHVFHLSSRKPCPRSRDVWFWSSQQLTWNQTTARLLLASVVSTVTPLALESFLSLSKRIPE